MARFEFLLVELDLRDRVARRVKAASEQEAAALNAEINYLIMRRNAITCRRAA